MNKLAALEALDMAKKAHVGWRLHAQSVMAGVRVEDRVPAVHTECDFGKWYHGEGKAELSQLSAYADIDEPHRQLHAAYQRLHDELFDEHGKPRLARESTSIRHFETERLAKARSHLKDLVEISDQLLERMVVLEEQIRASD